MSNDSTEWAYRQRVRNPGGKSVLAYLAWCHNGKTGLCCPSQGTIAEACSMSVRSVCEHLANLEADGFIERTPGPFRPNGHRTSDRVRLMFDRDPARPIGREPKKRAKGVGAIGHPADSAGSQPATSAGSPLEDSAPSQPAESAETTGESCIVTGSINPNENSSTKNSLSAHAKKSTARGTRITAGWRPPAEAIEWARSKGIADELARRETEKFVNYFVAAPGRGGTKLDWPATWRNWMLRAQEQQPGSALARINGSRPSPGRQRMDDADAVIERFERMEAEQAAAASGAGQLDLPEVAS